MPSQELSRFRKTRRSFRCARQLVRLSPPAKGIEAQAHSAIGGHSDFQREFEPINTFQSDRLARQGPLLSLGDKEDPVAPAFTLRKVPSNQPFGWPSARDAIIRSERRRSDGMRFHSS
jgi:hypothetical protein